MEAFFFFFLIMDIKGQELISWVWEVRRTFKKDGKNIKNVDEHLVPFFQSVGKQIIKERESDRERRQCSCM